MASKRGRKIFSSIFPKLGSSFFALNMSLGENRDLLIKVNPLAYGRTAPSFAQAACVPIETPRAEPEMQLEHRSFPSSLAPSKVCNTRHWFEAQHPPLPIRELSQATGHAGSGVWGLRLTQCLRDEFTNVSVIQTLCPSAHFPYTAYPSPLRDHEPHTGQMGEASGHLNYSHGESQQCRLPLSFTPRVSGKSITHPQTP